MESSNKECPPLLQKEPREETWVHSCAKVFSQIDRRATEIEIGNLHEDGTAVAKTPILTIVQLMDAIVDLQWHPSTERSSG